MSYIIFKTLQFNDLNKGLVLGHGHVHNNDNINKIKNVDDWFMIDIDPKNLPDYICDITSEQDMNYFPNNYFDCIFAEYCFPFTYNTFINNLHRIIKKEGIIYIAGWFSIYYHFITYEEQNDI